MLGGDVVTLWFDAKPENDAGNDAENAFGADKQMFQIESRVVLYIAIHRRSGVAGHRSV